MDLDNMKVKVEVDLSDVMKQLMALHGVDDSHSTLGPGLGNVDEVSQSYSLYDRYINTVLEWTGDSNAKPRYINRQLYDAVMMDEFDSIDIHYRRGDGATVSALALAKLMDNVALLVKDESVARRLGYISRVNVISTGSIIVSQFLRDIENKKVLICDGSTCPPLIGGADYSDKKIVCLNAHN